jgi:AcrR family transcriptional regulator
VARPIGADAEATRARILAHAARLFSERGGGHTSMRDIAGAAQVSLATVHHYFSSKDELYRSAVDAMYVELSALREELMAAVVGASDLKGVIEEAVRTAYRFARAHRPAVQLTMRTTIDLGGELPEERRTGHLLPFLDEGAALLAQMTGLPEERARLSLLSLNHLITRYALTAPGEMGIVTAKRSEQAAERAIEDHLVLAARSLLALD